MEHASNERLNLIEYQLVMASLTYLCKRTKKENIYGGFVLSGQHFSML